ncbi:MAG: hypothetical protein AAF591_01285 [Verrucomicrobiota bacterium]
MVAPTSPHNPAPSSPDLSEPPDSDSPFQKVLCPACLELVYENAVLCPHCRASQSFLGGTLPYESIFAEGFIYRRAANNPQSPVVVLGIWIIFGIPVLTFLVSIAVFGMIPFYYGLNDSGPLEHARFVTPLFWLGYLCLCIAFLWQSTRNYLRYRKSPHEIPDSISTSTKKD